VIYTTLRRHKEYGPCADGWRAYLQHVGKTQVDDDPVPMDDVLQVVGLGDAAWALRGFVVDVHDVRLFAVFCARQVEHLLIDERSRAAVRAAELYADSSITREELVAAWSSAMSAATEQSLASQAAEACCRVDTFDAAWGACLLAMQLVEPALLEQEFCRVFCSPVTD